MTRYPVLWREGKGPINAGTIELGSPDLILEGTCHGRRPSLRTIRYGDLAGMHLTLAPEESIYRELTLVLELRGSGALEIASRDGDGKLRDLEAQIATLVPEIPVD
jgi:hypothetical protein